MVLPLSQSQKLAYFGKEAIEVAVDAMFFVISPTDCNIVAIPLDILSASEGFTTLPILLEASLTAPMKLTIGFIKALNALVPNHIKGIANIAEAKNKPRTDKPATDAKTEIAIFAAPPNIDDTPSTALFISSGDTSVPAIEPAIPIIEDAKDKTTGVRAYRAAAPPIMAGIEVATAKLRYPNPARPAIAAMTDNAIAPAAPIIPAT